MLFIRESVCDAVINGQIFVHEAWKEELVRVMIRGDLQKGLFVVSCGHKEVLGGTVGLT